MADAKKLDGNDRAPTIQDEDAATLAAIDEGIRDANTGRTVPIEEVRKLLPLWITGSLHAKEP
jgi:predicted transcriptional regulator